MSGMIWAPILAIMGMLMPKLPAGMRAGRDELAGNHLDDLTRRRVSGKDAAELQEPTLSETENTLTAMRTRRKTSRKGHPLTCEFRPCPPNREI